MRDFLGQTLNPGDHVVYHTAGRYGTLQKGKVLSFTPKMVNIETTYRWGSGSRNTRVTPGSLIKYNPEAAA